jgi:hypothetical protein
MRDGALAWSAGVTANTAKMLIAATFRKIKSAGSFIGVLSRYCFRLVGFDPVQRD